MSTGISITSATYGTRSTNVDVTAAVTAKLKGGVLSLQVSPDGIGVQDPAPGELKYLTIVYTINGGSANNMTKKDGDAVYVNAPPATEATGLQITKAEYGYTDNWTDVTNAVQDLMDKNNSINVTVGFKQLGLPDPNPNKQKQLRVEYTINGATQYQILNDGDQFAINAPPLEDTSGPGLSDNAGSILGMLYGGVAKACGAFLYVLSIAVAYKFGNYFIHPLIWAILAFFLPFFAFWGLPFITLGVRLFKSADFVPA